MAIVRDLIVLAYLVGFALALGGLLTQWRDAEPAVTDQVLWGTLVQGVCAVLLAATAGGRPSWTRTLIEFVVWLVLAVLVCANRRWDSIPRGLWALLCGLTLVEVALPVLWH